MLNRVEPLRNELQSLEKEAEENKLKHQEVQKLIAGLEKSIARYKDEYAVLISQAQAIKADLAAVEAKVKGGTLCREHMESKRKPNWHLFLPKN